MRGIYRVRLLEIKLKDYFLMLKVIERSGVLVERLVYN